MKNLSLVLFIALFCNVYLTGQHLNINFDIEFNINEDSIELTDEFDIEGEVTNISNSNLSGDIYLDFFVGTSIPPSFFNAVTLSDTIPVSGTILPGDNEDFELEEISATDPLFNLQINAHNIIIIWPRLGPGESGDSIKFYIDTLFVKPNPATVFNQNIEIQSLNVYPNPVTENNLTIDLSELSSEPYYLTIWTILGQKLRSEIPLQGGQINQFSTQGLNDGVILAELHTKNGKLTKQKRIILQSNQY